jgi:uncharacterized membrane protein
MKDNIRKVTYGGVLSALVFLATAVLVITPPFIKGYFNFGDGTIFAAAVVLGPFAAIPAALGSALADLYLGYAIFMPATFIIKGLMGLIAGYFFSKSAKLPIFKQAVVMVACELVMIGGYFAYEVLLYGLAGAVPELATNSLQGVAGVALGLAMVPLARRIPVKSRL